jgi:hypothetical protein
VKERTRRLYEAQVKRGIPVQEIESAMRRVLAEVLGQLPEKLIHSFSEGLNIDASQITVLSSDIAPAFFTVAAVMFNVARLTAFLPEGKRQPRSSDVGDVFHATYLPFVDIFRADGFVSSAIADAKLPFDATVVQNFRQLVPAIERRLA